VPEKIILELAIVIASAAVLAVAAHYLRQPLVVAYIAAGFLIGPHSPVPGLALMEQADFIRGVGELGLVLLLFLLGLVLHPGRLLQVFRQASLVTLCSATAFFGVGLGLSLAVGYVAGESLSLAPMHAVFIGFATAFSSTLLAVKLLPTRRLHESAVGTIAIGILIVQDVLAILVLVAMAVLGPGGGAARGVWWRLPMGIAMLAAAFPVEQYGLRRLMRHVEQYPELLFVLGVAWCFVLAEGAEALGFSREIGAFVAGLAVKPYLFRLFLRAVRTERRLAEEAGWRLGQCSEFGLVVAFLALDQGLIGRQAFEIILVTTLLSFLVSTYIVVLKYPSPLGVSPGMHQV